ncbi:predicted protein [Chaetomium globosum CBS 148.51]|uniref:Uncharacterized protein n=1 Tax=Chaetomium globosum (strain ATCC 6205 / CBS 148.51 / DSM 1962 / NBRC 6347 / NRRL 1970) TaxID=306901 RepID=Q2H7I4_CHAGB|nr:uncharacterized protein CHGG_05381 [Chaetomium globosum CBS 148.51]EAQ88762.1 predicted protein [Chaetomium globosum CBS 148.51]
MLLVTLALDPPVIEWLIFAGTYAMRTASKPAVKRTFGALLLFAFFLLAVISIPTDSTFEPKPTSPVLTSAFATSKLEAYRTAHRTLTDPLQRCLYHRDSGIPDWYSIPRLCWGEMLVDKLQAVKGAIRADAKALFKETCAAVRKLRGHFGGGQGAAAKSEKETESANQQNQSNPAEIFWDRMWENMLTNVRQCLDWFMDTILSLSARMKAAH